MKIPISARVEKYTEDIAIWIYDKEVVTIRKTLTASTGEQPPRTTLMSIYISDVLKIYGKVRDWLDAKEMKNAKTK